MSLWQRTQQLDSAALRQINSLYGPHFPIEVRHYFADWLESQPWDQMDPDNPAHVPHAKIVVEALIGHLEAKAQELAQQGREDTFFLRFRFEEIAQQFRILYVRDSLALVRIVRHCLATEQQLVNQNEAGSSGDSGQLSNTVLVQQQIMKAFDENSLMTQDTEVILKQLQQSQESFLIQYQEMCRLQAMVQKMQNHPDESYRKQQEVYAKKKMEMEVLLSREAESLQEKRSGLVDKFQNNLKLLGTLQHLIVGEELVKWKRQQQLAGSGGPQPGSLDILQSWCEYLAEFIWRNRQQIRQIEMLKAQLPMHRPGPGLMEELTQSVGSLLSTLVTNTFVIEKQPPQVLKTQTKFMSSVRLLVGGKLNVHMNPPEVIVNIVNEKQARDLLSSNKLTGDMRLESQTSGDIINNRRVMEYHPASGTLNVTFRNMQLKKIKRPDKKGAEVAVTEEKFTLLFTSRFSIGGGELFFAVRTISHPVVVVVHGNQLPNAEATILWDNFFSEATRVPFHVPDHVPWSMAGQALNARFTMSNVRELSVENLDYLSQKALHSAPQAEDQNMRVLSWQAFNKDPLPGRNFTFWEWFYGIMDLVRRHLLGPWQDGLIVGFLTKQQAQELLQIRPPGTFLLRFSDSEVGGVTVAWVADNDQGERQVWNLQPWWAKDFAIRSLADRINDLPQLQYLYPDVPKNSAFGQYYNPSPLQESNSKNDYVSTILSVTIPGSSGPAPQIFENAATPASQASLDVMKTDTSKVRDSAEMAITFFGTQSASIQSPEGGSAVGAGDMDGMMDLPAFASGATPTEDLSAFLLNLHSSTS
eukprot:m.11888 g.11888  ORF g.11888 m.11888 type:complete len:812 (+) comp23673_c0_seq1:85-2520(+)